MPCLYVSLFPYKKGLSDDVPIGRDSSRLRKGEATPGRSTFGGVRSVNPSNFNPIPIYASRQYQCPSLYSCSDLR